MKMVLASHNPGKLKEFQCLFEPYEIELIPLPHFNIPPVEETGLTFVENAILKARAACQCSGLPAISDDSGLAVDALGGQPGIYSARFAGPNATAVDHTEKLLAALSEVPEAQRTARFHCVIVLMQHAEDPSPLISHGVWEGHILTQSIGHGGFGYDPVFFDPTYQCSAAELTMEQKSQLSHRAKAIRPLLQYFAEHS